MIKLLKQSYKPIIVLLSVVNLSVSGHPFTHNKMPYKIPRGIFLLLPAEIYPPEKILKEKFIKGISVRVRWQDVEKLPGKYNWEYLDKIFEIAKKEHKQVFLRLLGGFWAPSWIYNKGVPSFKIELQGKGFIAKKFIKKYGKDIKLPVVWNKKYLKFWSSFVKAVGKRYSLKPELVLVHLSGPTFFSAEVILARNQKELEKLISCGFNEKKFLEAWRETIEVFKSAFPRKPLSLNLHFVIKETNLHSKLTELSYKLLKRRLVIQGNWLTLRHTLWLTKDENIPNKEMLDLFWRAHVRGIPVGFQEAYPFSKIIKRHNISLSKLKELRKELLKLFSKFKANYIEIYPEDAEDSFWKELWKVFAQGI